MDPKYIVIALLTVTFILLIYIHGGEGFTTKKEKASAIYNWFAQNKNPRYIKYKNDLNGESNIVEYEDVLTLSKNKNLSIKSVEGVI